MLNTLQIEGISEDKRPLSYLTQSFEPLWYEIFSYRITLAVVSLLFGFSRLQQFTISWLLFSNIRKDAEKATQP